MVYGSSGFWAIEVKNTDRLRPADVRALREFAQDYPECEPLLLHRGRDRLDMGGVRCVPVGPFLGRLRPSEPLTAGL